MYYADCIGECGFARWHVRCQERPVLSPELTRLVLLIFALLGFASTAFGEVPTTSFVVEDLLKGVVEIHADILQYEDARPVTQPSAGSGFILSTDPQRREIMIVTNHHVIAQASWISVTFADGTSVDSDVEGAVAVVGQDVAVDVAVLKMNLDGFRSPRFSDLKVLDWGVSSNVKFGDVVHAFGNALDMKTQHSPGSISRTNVYLGNPLGKNVNVGWGDNARVLYFATDARIIQGNSGGPLTNEDGEVIAMAALMSRDGAIGYAIPSDRVRESVMKILTDRPLRSYVGLGLQPLPKFGNPSPEDSTGALVTFVAPGSPADRAGLQPRDRLYWLGHRKDGKRIFTRMGIPPSQLEDFVSKVWDPLEGTPAPGDTIDIVRFSHRKARTDTVFVVPEADRRSVADRIPCPPLHMVVSEITEGDRQFYPGLRDQRGLRIVDFDSKYFPADVDPTGAILTAVLFQENSREIECFADLSELCEVESPTGRAILHLTGAWGNKILQIPVPMGDANIGSADSTRGYKR